MNWQVSTRIKNFLFKKPPAELAPENAYDLWAGTYDAQPDNLMLALDEEVVAKLLRRIPLTNKVVIDYGCGTGRHWPKLLAERPLQLRGYDVSAGMLAQLIAKYPYAEVVKIDENTVPDMPAQSADVIISTLTVAHIEDLDQLFAAWAGALKPDGDIVITDFHPQALAMGGKRTFTHQNNPVAVVNHVHDLPTIIHRLNEYGFRISGLEERVVDEGMKPFYEKQNALHVYERFKGVPIIYGISLSRRNYGTGEC